MQQEYIAFNERGTSPSGKTKVWSVVSTSGTILGVIKWFGRWRCYCFFPDNDTIFNSGCLSMITKFCATQTAVHRGE